MNILKKSDNALRKILTNIRFPKLLIFVSIMISSLGSLMGLVIPSMTGRFVDRFSLAKINPVFILIFFLIFISNVILSGVGMFLLRKVGEKIIYSLRENLWKKVIFLKLPFFDANESGELMSRLTDDTLVINRFISEKIPNIFPSFITILGSIIILLLMDWQLTLLALIIVPLFLLIILPLSKKMQNISIDTQREIARFNGFLGRILSNMSLVKASTKEYREVENSQKNLSEIYNLGIRQAKIFSIIQPISGMLLLITVGILLGVGGIKVSSGSISSGTLVAMLFYIFQLTNPLANLSTVLTEFQRAVGASNRISNILENETEYEENFHIKSIGCENLSFSNVSFRYNSTLILNDITFSAPKNELTAIVGPSGSGKSTILKLIERFYDSYEGKIYYGNKKIEDFHLQNWRGNIGFVMQDNPMINDSIKNNILYAQHNTNISKETLEYYSKLANSHYFITSKEHSYDTIVGENGVKLSGGEKQRIDLARNFIKDPQLLLLDEATSNLDSKTEKKIQESINYIMANRTTIIVAHRLSTIKKAKKIIFLDDGKITGEGTHHYLMENHSKYKEFVHNQLM